MSGHLSGSVAGNELVHFPVEIRVHTPTGQQVRDVALRGPVPDRPLLHGGPRDPQRPEEAVLTVCPGLG